MKLFNLINKFRSEEEGAVTVDWVVLTAAVVGLGILAMSFIQPAVQTASTGIAGQLTAAQTNNSTAN